MIYVLCTTSVVLRINVLFLVPCLVLSPCFPSKSLGLENRWLSSVSEEGERRRWTLHPTVRGLGTLRTWVVSHVGCNHVDYVISCMCRRVLFRRKVVRFYTNFSRNFVNNTRTLCVLWPFRQEINLEKTDTFSYTGKIRNDIFFYTQINNKGPKGRVRPGHWRCTVVRSGFCTVCVLPTDTGRAYD